MDFFSYLSGFGVDGQKAMDYDRRYCSSLAGGKAASGELKGLEEFSHIWAVVVGIVFAYGTEGHPALKTLMPTLKAAYDKLESAGNQENENKGLAYYLKYYEN